MTMISDLAASVWLSIAGIVLSNQASPFFTGMMIDIRISVLKIDVA